MCGLGVKLSHIGGFCKIKLNKKSILVGILVLILISFSGLGASSCTKASSSPSALDLLTARVITLEASVTSLTNSTGNYATKSSLDSLQASLNTAKSDLAILITTVGGKATAQQVTDLTTRIVALETSIATIQAKVTTLTADMVTLVAGTSTSSGDFTASFSTITSGIQAIAKSTTARTIAFKVTIYPIAGSAYSSIPITGATDYTDAMQKCYSATTLLNRSFQADIRYNSTATIDKWQIYSLTFYTTAVNLVAGVQGTWSILFVVNPAISYTIQIDVIYAPSGTGSSGGGI